MASSVKTIPITALSLLALPYGGSGFLEDVKKFARPRSQLGRIAIANSLHIDQLRADAKRKRAGFDERRGGVQ